MLQVLNLASAAVATGGSTHWRSSEETSIDDAIETQKSSPASTKATAPGMHATDASTSVAGINHQTQYCRAGAAE